MLSETKVQTAISCIPRPADDLTAASAVVCGGASTFPAEHQFVVSHGSLSVELEKLWRQHLERVDDPAHYNSPEFFLEPCWQGLQPFAILALEQGRVVAVVTGTHMGDRMICGQRGRPQVSVERNADALAATHTLAQGLMSEAGRAKLITLFSWTRLPGFEQQSYRACEREGCVVLDLRRGAEELYKDFHETRKRNIRAAVRNGIEVREATTMEDLAAYWEVVSAWRNTKRKTIRHACSFAAAEKVHSMRGNHLRFLASYQGRVIAVTGVRFFPGGLIEYANNSSLDEFTHLRPNDLLIWKTIQWASAMGFSRYSLGSSHPFLRKSGGTLVPTYRYRLDRTFLRRHDLKEYTAAIARKMFYSMPTPVRGSIRKVLRKAG